LLIMTGRGRARL